MNHPQKNTQPVKFSASLSHNKDLIHARFERDDTIVFRDVVNMYHPNLQCCVVFLDAISDAYFINESIIKPLSKIKLPTDTISASLFPNIVNCNETHAFHFVDEAVFYMLRGDSLLLVQGLDEVFVLNTKGGSVRAVAEPDSEKNLLGPRDGFTEMLLTNISLIRRRLQTSDLKLETSYIGTRSNTRICLAYLDDLVDKNTLCELKTRLAKIHIDAILDSNYIDECIKDSPLSPFKTIGKSEKPDIIAAKLLEGRIAILVDGSPIVLTVPYLFIENFQANDDYYVNCIFSSIGRSLRIIGFLFSIALPSFYIALIDFHQEMLPGMLLLNVARATYNVPLSATAECILMLLLFEVLRETGVRMPSKSDQALSIVGALVFGQAAISAGVVSKAVVIIVAFVGITGLLVPKLKGASIICRFLCVFLTTVYGLYGTFFGLLIIFIHLLSITSFNAFYLTGFGATTTQRTKDILWRAPIWLMRDRPPFVAKEKRKRASVQ